MKIHLPSGAAKILASLTDAGYEAYIVGGCVRDSLMGRTPSDWDITTSARPDEVKALFPKTIDTGIRHGTLTVRRDGESYEVTTFRVDGDYADHRHPDGVTFTGQLAEDLKRRDFTINAMAYNDERGVIDLFGGQTDLRDGIVRAVGDPGERFREDALRMMRAVRFSAQLGFEMEDATRDAVREQASTLSAVSGERIRDELEKLLLSAHPERVRDLWSLGLTAVFFPEFDAMMATAQNNPHHCYSVGEHTIAALMAGVRVDGAQTSRDCGMSPEETARLLRLTVLLHDCAKPLTKTTDAEGIDHFKGHPQKGADLAGEILRRWKEDNRTIARVKNLIRWHDQRPESDAVTVRETAARVGRPDFPLLLDVMEADVHGQSSFLQQEKLTRLAEIRTVWRRIVETGEPVALSDLAVTGQDLIGAGMKPGPGIGELLDVMFRDVLKHPEHNNREWMMEHYAGRMRHED
ncbi:MAG: CCA tRNA nucleotidyltransferase [Lachnospiraceae bacterium]|nr:CCA tRNA nucleotidyltransferase [Lachnospiraceae bacterium]